MVTVKTLGKATLTHVFDVEDVQCADIIKIPEGKLVVATTTTGLQLLELQYEVDGKKAVVHFAKALIRQLDDKGKIGLTSPDVARFFLPAGVTAESLNPHGGYTINLSTYKPQGVSEAPFPIPDTSVLYYEWKLTISPTKHIFDLKVIGDVHKAWITRLIREYNFVEPPMYSRTWITDESKFAKQENDEAVPEPKEGEIRQGNYALPKVAPFRITLPETMAVGQSAGFRWWCMMAIDGPLVRLPPVPKPRPVAELAANGDA
ncbi:hypothetical protein ABW21_db0207531 [Orbilia brochopaga]|nr:hypothetical protein ABW21_db0207531 [Drechslerella brochopaga]